MMPDNLDYKDKDSELWDQFRGGNQPAYTSLMEKYSRSLFTYGYRICPDRDFVKDCIQEVFLELWKRRERISPTASVKWYLYKAVRLRIFRDQSQWNRNEQINEDYQFVVEFNIESKLIHDFEFQELTTRINTILNGLPARQREIMYLRFYENLDFDQIAEIMNINKQSLHNLLQKAYKKFRIEWLLIILLLPYLKVN